MEIFSYINEEFFATSVTPEQTDLLLKDGWRHFGDHFYRYNLGVYNNEIRMIFALRINLAKYSPSKSQRRNLQRNRDLQTVIRPIEITPEKEQLFARHKTRFSFGVPQSLYDFLSREPATVPCEARELCVYRGNELLAVAFFDLGRHTTSSVYAMFEPTETARGLGIFTMLKELEFTRETGRDFYYHGYAYEGNSFYDYKKRFRGLETFDWSESWHEFDENYFDRFI